MKLKALVLRNLLVVQIGVFIILLAVQFLSVYDNITVIGSLILWLVANVILVMI